MSQGNHLYFHVCTLRNKQLIQLYKIKEIGIVTLRTVNSYPEHLSNSQQPFQNQDFANFQYHWNDFFPK